MNKRRLAESGAAVVLILCAPIALWAQQQQPGTALQSAAANRAAPVAPPPSLEGAPIAMMADLGSGRILAAKETDRRFIPASLTKLMTVYTAFELLDEGKLHLNQHFLVTPETARKWGGRGSSMFVRPRERISVDSLLAGIVTVSANDGSVVLAEGATGSVDNFTRLMNAEAQELGMDDSHFNTPNGWPDEGRTFTSARDLATLATALITRHPQKYRRYFSIREFTWNDITQKHHNPILDSVAGADGLKTGFTNEAGFGFVGSAERNGRRVVMVIGNTDSSRERKTIARDFMNWAFDGWSSRRLFGKGQVVGTAQVQNGSDGKVDLVVRRPLFATAPRGTVPDPVAAIRYDGPVVAPIRAGQHVADLEIVSAGRRPQTVPLFAAENVAEAGWWQRLRNGLSGLI